MSTVNEELKTPVVGEFDVIVVGGGPAGVGAAFASARSGKKTLVIEQFNCLGGVATAGGHAQMTIYHEWSSPDRPIIGGIAREVGNRLVDMGVGQWKTQIFFEIEGLKRLYEIMVKEEENLSVLYHTFFCDTIVENNEVKGVIVQNKTGRLAYKAKRVIDCTGDGDACFRAGCEYEFGRGEDRGCQPVTLMFTIGGVDWNRVEEFTKNYREKYASDNVNWKLERVFKEAIEKGDMRPFQTGIMGWWHTNTREDQVGINFTHVVNIDTTDASDLTEATFEARKQAYETIEVYKKYIPGMENCYMVSTPSTIGTRESRRIMGDYLLHEDDLMNQKLFDDTIALGSFFIDIHNIDGAGMSPTVWYPPKGFKYGIPYRSLVPKKIENILMAGRNISVTHKALGSTRVMAQCIAMGEAAGIASSISIDSNKPLRGIDINTLKEEITKRGGLLTAEDVDMASEEYAKTGKLSTPNYK